MSFKIARIQIWKLYESILFGKQIWIYFQNVAFIIKHMYVNTLDINHRLDIMIAFFFNVLLEIIIIRMSL